MKTENNTAGSRAAQNKAAQKFKALYHQKKFHQQYTYSGPLGPVCNVEETSLVLWSPLSEKADLNLYHTDSDESPYAVLPMKPGEHGTWLFETRECLHGVYYDFSLTMEGKTRQALDPYARACGANGQRDMFVDLKRTDPPGMSEDKAPSRPAAPIVYELHVKEFSWDPAGGFSPQHRGRYTAFTQMKAKGMEYLKSLGATHVQLMPIYDFGSVDETGSADQCNWGYDPKNYNIPEGSYASDPHRGDVRIRECKEMIRALHQSGLRVIMDVVYNHTYSLDTALQQTMPWYYYRTWDSGELSNGSCCGNDIASERPMCARYILDSVLYWAQEFHIDGFRFDLMGLIDVDLMNRIRQALDERFGEGEKLIYGEPWAPMATAAEGDRTVLAVRANFGSVDRGIGLFNDDIRDAVKGSVFDKKAPGFVNGGNGLEKRIAEGIMAGRNPDPGCVIKAASQTITYVSSHDNHTLWDKLTNTTEDEKLRLMQNRMAAAICMTCQGIPFLLSGEEFLRTKEGLDNSYNAPISINRLDWLLTEKNRDMVEYYRGLIELRGHLPGLYDPSAEAYKRITILEAGEGVVAFTADNSPSTEWQQLFIVYNSTKEKIRRELPDGEWQLLADGENSYLWKSSTRSSAGHACTLRRCDIHEGVKGAVMLAPVSVFIFGKPAD